MYLLAIVLVDYDKLEPLLSAFREAGVPGATVLDSFGMGPGSMALSKNPFIAKLQHLISENKTLHQTIFSVVESKETLERAIEAAKKIVGEFSLPNTGILFALPLFKVEGLAKQEVVLESKK